VTTSPEEESAIPVPAAAPPPARLVFTTATPARTPPVEELAPPNAPATDEPATTAPTTAAVSAILSSGLRCLSVISGLGTILQGEHASIRDNCGSREPSVKTGVFGGGPRLTQPLQTRTLPEFPSSERRSLR